MAQRTVTTWTNGVPTTSTIEIPDEIDREERIGAQMDQAIAILSGHLDNWTNLTTLATLRPVLQTMLVIQLHMLRMLRRRFDQDES